MVLRRSLAAYLFLSRRMWDRLPAFVRLCSLGRAYGRHLHAMVCLHDERRQNHSTFFLRNRPELELMRNLLDQKAYGASLSISVLACSKGAEVYSILWTIRSARPDLRITTNAIDVSQEILDFAERGVYSRSTPDVVSTPGGDVRVNLFERLTDAEVGSIFEVRGDQAKVRPWLKEGINWLRRDANDPELLTALGPQDIVVANRFLCHMKPAAAETCLGNIARLVKPGGYLFVSGIDLDVREKVAQAMGWTPVPDMIREIHQGDVSLTDSWPFGYWGLEPFSDNRPDWKLRYASAFQTDQIPLKYLQTNTVGR